VFDVCHVVAEALVDGNPKSKFKISVLIHETTICVHSHSSTKGEVQLYRTQENLRDMEVGH
jgi:hypothetical protein